MREFKDGAAYLAMRSGAPVLPVGIAGSQRMFPGRSRLPHRTRVTIRMGEPFTLSDGPVRRVDREALAAATARMSGAVAQLLPPEQRPGWSGGSEALAADLSYN